MKILNMVSGPLENNFYVVFDEITGQGLVIDTPLESSDKILSLINKHQIKTEAIVLTHFHWDHTAEAAELHRRTNAPIYIHPLDDIKIKDPMKYTLFPIPFEIEAVNDAKHLQHNDRLDIGSLSFEIYHTPGHSEGSICLIERKEKVAFVGDVIFNGSIGRFDFPGCSFETLMNSINDYIMTLPDDFRIYNGHGPATTVGQERRNNPFINSETMDHL